MDCLFIALRINCVTVNASRFDVDRIVDSFPFYSIVRKFLFSNVTGRQLVLIFVHVVYFSYFPSVCYEELHQKISPK